MAVVSRLSTRVFFRTRFASPTAITLTVLSLVLPALQALAKTLAPFPNPIRVEGHTDNKPIKTVLFPSNWELSSARAIAVVKFLNKEGITNDHLVAAGYGEYQPLSLMDVLPLADTLNLDSNVKGLRIGWLGSIWPDLPLAPGVREVCETALKTFRDLGCEVEPCQLDVPREQNWTAWLETIPALAAGHSSRSASAPSAASRSHGTASG